MNSLDCLYASHKLSSDNPLCEGCTILAQSKPCYSVQDYATLGEAQVLFLSDSFRYRFGKARAFSDNEEALIKEVFPYPHAMSTSNVKEDDMIPDNMKICRQHLEATIDKVKPVLVFPCGNLAMKMLIRKSGITSKRGKSFIYTTELGHSCTVVPLFHPFSVIKEPRHRFLFESDIKNAYDKYILGKISDEALKYKVVTTLKEVEDLCDQLQDTNKTVAADIETTGLNFLKDSVQTIALSTEDGTWVLPLDHKDSPFIKGSDHHLKVWEVLRKILENPNNKKVFHNAKFDLKFLIRHGISATNVWDTKIMHHLIDENVPKSLMDLVKLYFPTELENL